MKPQNFEESLIWYVIIGTYVIYALGLVFPVYSSLAWILSGYLVFKLLLQTKTTPLEEKITVPWLTWLW
ncbi:MAG: O-antigen ligase domain-containing protein, partial [Cyanobacteria bacterium J06632_19]